MVYIKKSWQSTGNLDPGVQFPKSDGNLKWSRISVLWLCHSKSYSPVIHKCIDHLIRCYEILGTSRFHNLSAFQNHGKKIKLNTSFSPKKNQNGLLECMYPCVHLERIGIAEVTGTVDDIIGSNPLIYPNWSNCQCMFEEIPFTKQKGSGKNNTYLGVTYGIYSYIYHTNSTKCRWTYRILILWVYISFVLQGEMWHPGSHLSRGTALWLREAMLDASLASLTSWCFDITFVVRCDHEGPSEAWETWLPKGTISSSS